MGRSLRRRDGHNKIAMIGDCSCLLGRTCSGTRRGKRPLAAQHLVVMTFLQYSVTSLSDSRFWTIPISTVHGAAGMRFNGKDYLSDVGFGDFTFAPLKFELDLEQKDENGFFKIDKSNEYYQVNKRVDGNWKPEYKFKLSSRDFSDFGKMCTYHQTSQKSHFTQGRFCTLATEKGRVTISDSKLKFTIDNEVTEVPIGQREFDENLLKYFSIKLNN